MASLSALSSITGLKVQSLKACGVSRTSATRSAGVVCSAGAPWEKVSKVLVATGAGLLIATSANAATIKLGSDSGALVFEPATTFVKSGEKITFINNAGFPHNIIFDDEVIPEGVDPETISQADYLNGPGEEYSVTLTAPGEYGIYCEPHKAGGMKGSITVE